MIKNTAKAIRILTVPPIMVLGLLMLLVFEKADVFYTLSQFAWTILFLMAIPFLAYPISRFVKKIREKGREGQRNLAIVLSLLGYTCGLIFALFFETGHYLLVIFLTYFLSIVLLIFLNKVIKIKASGHACSIAGPLTLCIYFLGVQSIIWCLVIFSLVIWSSLILKRHTIMELVFGSLASITSFFISLLIVFAYYGSF